MPFFPRILEVFWGNGIIRIFLSPLPRARAPGEGDAGISSSRDRGLELELGEPGLLQSRGSIPLENPGAARDSQMELGGILGRRDPPGGGSEGEGPFLGEVPGASGRFGVTAAFVTSSSSSRINPGFNNSNLIIPIYSSQFPAQLGAPQPGLCLGALMSAN